MFASGVAGWTIYGILKRDGVIVAANAVTLVLVIVVMVVKLGEVKPSQRAPDRSTETPGPSR